MKTIFQQWKKRPQQLIRSISRHGGEEDSCISKELLLVVTLLTEDGEEEINDLVGKGYTTQKRRRMILQ